MCTLEGEESLRLLWKKQLHGCKVKVHVGRHYKVECAVWFCGHYQPMYTY